MLRRGGLYVSCEWAWWPTLDDGGNLKDRAPRAHAFLEAVRATLSERRGIQEAAPRVAHLLQASGLFTAVATRDYPVPVGDWSPHPHLRQLGVAFRGHVETYGRSLGLVLLEGRYARRAHELVEGYIRDMREVAGLVFVYHTVHARRQ